MKKAIFIVGPTAVGKTDLAFSVAPKFPSVLISADSVQVYKGADIISGKDLPKEAKLIQDHYLINSTPFYLLGIASPFESFSVKDFFEKANKIVSEAIDKSKIPVVVGGTGFYADALFTKVDTLNIPPNEELRGELNTKNVYELQENLKSVNPERFSRMNDSDAKNKRRLIRAIEISLVSNKNEVDPIFNTDKILTIGLKSSMEDIRKKIKWRVDERIEEGALDEASTLFKNYNNLSNQIKRANGYKELFSYLAGEISLDEAKEKWIIADYRHAKKQMVWFKRNESIIWFDVREEGYKDKVFELIKNNFKLYN